MTDTTLRDYLENLVEDGAAIVVDEPVSPEYHAPKRSAATCRPLVFNDLGNGWRGVMNLVSDRATIARALDLPPDRVLPTLASARFDGEVAIDGRLTTAPADLGAIPVMKHYPGGRRAVHHGRDRLLPVRRRAERIDPPDAGRRTPTGSWPGSSRGGTRTTSTAGRSPTERPCPSRSRSGSHPAVMLAASTRVPEGKETRVRGGLLGRRTACPECGTVSACPMQRSCWRG